LLVTREVELFSSTKAFAMAQIISRYKVHEKQQAYSKKQAIEDLSETSILSDDFSLGNRLRKVRSQGIF
jgi:hypothetical protein